MKKQAAYLLAACLLLVFLTACFSESRVQNGQALQLEQSVPAPAQTDFLPETAPEPDKEAFEAEVQAPAFEDAPPLAKDAPAVTVNQTELDVFQGDSGYCLRLDLYAGAVNATLHQNHEADGQYSCRLQAPMFRAYFHAGSDDVFFDGTHWYGPMDLLVERQGFRRFTDEENNHVYYTTDLPGAKTPDGCRVPVLMYHAVSDDCWGFSSLFVSPDDMEQQLKLLVDEGFSPIWFEDLPHADEYEKPVILTFDDGYDDNYTELYPLLQKYNVKATIFVIAGQLGTPHKMTAEQVKALSDSGLVSIQSHTMTHDLLDEMNEEKLIYQLKESQLTIARLTGKVPYTICYPVGHNNVLTREVAARYYDFGVLMNGGGYTTGTDPLLVPRYYVDRQTDLWTFRSMASGQ